MLIKACLCIAKSKILKLEREAVTIGENTKYDLGVVCWQLGTGWSQTLEQGAQGGAGVSASVQEVSGCDTGDMV